MQVVVITGLAQGMGLEVARQLGMELIDLSGLMRKLDSEQPEPQTPQSDPV